MPTPVTEAVRLAKEALGEVSAEELAAYIATNFGLKVKPVVVNITLASFRGKAVLEQTKQRALELAAKLAAEAPAEKPKRRKAKAAQGGPSPAAGP